MVRSMRGGKGVEVEGGGIGGVVMSDVRERSYPSNHDDKREKAINARCLRSP